MSQYNHCMSDASVQHAQFRKIREEASKARNKILLSGNSSRRRLPPSLAFHGRFCPVPPRGGGGEQGFADKTNGQTEETFESRDRVKALACRRISKPRKGAERNRPCAWRQRHDL